MEDWIVLHLFSYTGYMRNGIFLRPTNKVCRSGDSFPILKVCGSKPHHDIVEQMLQFLYMQKGSPTDDKTPVVR